MNYSGVTQLVLKLGLLSLFTDMSSEMIFPLLPVFLSTLPGGGPFAIGIIEGVAEATASFLKLISGLWTDRIRKRVPFIAAGYGIASIVRPFIAFASIWPTVLILRFVDRVGKGLRSSPRDTLIAESVSPENIGKAFGFQRIMDHSGAVAGPIIAFALMSMFGLSIRQVILFAAIPSAIVITILFSIKEPKQAFSEKKKENTTEISSFSNDYRLLLTAVFIFTLGNSTDAFLLLRLNGTGVAAKYIALLWSIHHVFKIIGAWFGGKFSDIYGRKPLVLAGLGLYAAVYTAFGISGSAAFLIATFIIYGASIGVLEPAERAWISELSPEGRRGTAFGFYHASIGFGALPASVVFGFLWKLYGQMTAFLTGASLAAIAGIIVIFISNGKSSE